jgi:hypothetical protein
VAVLWTKVAKRGGFLQASTGGRLYFLIHPPTREIRVNNITQSVVANPVPNLQCDSGESK